MNITALAFATIFVGIPTCAGAYFLVCYFGHEKVTNGVAGLLLGIGVSCVLVFIYPESRFSQVDRSILVPWVLGVSFLLGAVSGLVARRRRLTRPNQDG